MIKRLCQNAYLQKSPQHYIHLLLLCFPRYTPTHPAHHLVLHRHYHHHLLPAHYMTSFSLSQPQQHRRSTLLLQLKS